MKSHSYSNSEYDVLHSLILQLYSVLGADSEELSLQFAVCSWDSTNTQWSINIALKNTGPTPAILVAVFINDIEVNEYASTTASTEQTATDMTDSLFLEKNSTTTIEVYIDELRKYIYKTPLSQKNSEKWGVSNKLS